ncbi:MAG: hypothetical protein JWL76_2468 [Thermoleophilia bacterium]|nr:hypothetical protein [Thermoleophilia bacterium]
MIQRGISQIAFAAIAVVGLIACERPRARAPAEPVQTYVEYDSLPAPAPPPEPPPRPQVTSALLRVSIEFDQPPRRTQPYFDEYYQQWVQPTPELPPRLSIAPAIGTNAVLYRANGDAIRLSDSARRPPLSFDPRTGRYTTTKTYLPLAGDRFIGSPLAEGATFVDVSVNYASVLQAYGLRYLGVSNVTLEINGETMIDAAWPAVLDEQRTRFRITNNDLASRGSEDPSSAPR